jgi:hypothetical protein
VYSCVQGERIRWISHCHEEPELVQCDPETLAFVTRLAGAAKARPIEREA